MSIYAILLSALWFLGLYTLAYRPLAIYLNNKKQKELNEEIRFFKKYMVRSYYDLEDLDYDELTSYYNIEKSVQKIRF